MGQQKISDEQIIEIQSLYDKGFNIPQIEEKTSKSTSVIDRYIKAERIKPKIPAVPQTEESKAEKKEETTHVTLKAAEQPCPNCRKVIPADAKLCPYCGATIAKEETTLGLDPALEPWDWFKKFLESYGSRYGVKRPFIELNCDRVRMRNGELPLPVQLAKDLTIQQPGIKVDTAAYIAEVYGFHLNEYKARRQQLSEYWQQPYQGVQVPVSQSPVSQYQGIAVPMQPQPQGAYPQVQPYQGVTVPMQPQPQQQYANPIYAPYPRLESELERYARIQQLFQKTEEKNPITDRLEKENDALSMRLQEMENSMKNQMLAENQQLRTQVQQQGQAMRQYEENLRESQIKLQYEQSNKRTTEEDIKMKEVDHKYTVDMKKLDEGGKTREAIANAVKTGFSQVGQAIFATAQEMGSEEKRPMHGVTDTKNMWQSECPFCKTPITAPLDARMLTCPGCARQLEVTAPTPERQERPPPQESATVTVEHPLPPLEQTIPKATVGPPRVSECPFCKTKLTIPAGLKMVECPQCKQRLRVEAEAAPIIEQETLEPSVGAEQQVIEQEVFKHPKETHIEVPKEIHIDSPPPPEVITESQPVKDKDQIIKQPIAPSTRREPERFPKHKPETVIEKQARDMKEEMEKREREEAKELEKLRQRNEEENEIKRGKALKKVAEGIAIGEGVKKVEEELKKEDIPSTEELQPFSKDGYKLYETKTKSGRPFYYFGKQSDKGEPCTKIPDGYEISKNARSGVHNLKKIKGGK